MSITQLHSAYASVAKAEKESTTQDEQLRKACAGFESIFLNMIFKSMRSATMESGLIKKSNAEEIFTEMLDEEMSNQAAANSPNGLGDMMYREMLKIMPDANGEIKGSSIASAASALQKAYSDNKNMDKLSESKKTGGLLNLIN